MGKGQFLIQTSSYLSHCIRLSEDLLYFRRLQKRCGRQIDVYGSFWGIIFAQLKDRQAFAHCNGRSISLDGLVAAYVAPFSIIEWEIKAPQIVWYACISRRFFSGQDKHSPALLQWDGRFPQSYEEAVNFIKQSSVKEKIAHVVPESSVLERVRKVLNQSLGEEILVGDVAERFGMTEATLTKRFKATYGITPIKYRNKMRVFEAMSQLLHQGKPVTEVGFDVGFGDLGRFNKQFKKYANAKPSQYKYLTKKM